MMKCPDAKVHDPAGKIGESAGAPNNKKVLASLPKAGPKGGKAKGY